jgi:hypothetical protein
LEYKSSYPFVRIVENVSQQTLEVMAADQVLIHLREGVDVTDFQPMLKALELNVRMFNREKKIMVISVLNRELDAIPQTLSALSPWNGLFDSATPDFIQVR